MSEQRAHDDSTAGGQPPLQLGVIGLGTSWRRRYQPALAALAGHFSVRMVCDQVQRRAEIEAHALDCAVAGGPAQLLEDEQVEAVLLADPQWYGLWPLELACRAGKPVFCGPSLESENTRADGLVRQVRESRLPVLVALGPRLAPATHRLRDLIESELGSPRLLLCDLTQPLRPGRPDELLLGLQGLALVDWLAGFLGGAEPVSTAAVRATDFGSVVFHFDQGRIVQINRHRAPGASPAVRLRVVTRLGWAALQLPDRVSWSTGYGLHLHRLRAEPSPVVQMLLRFAQAVRSGQSPEPNLEDAARALRWLQLAQRSLVHAT